MQAESAETLALSSALDVRAAASLHQAIAARRGGPLTIDASAVERIGAQCLQVLLAASNAWRADKQAFAIAGASPAFADGLRLMASPSLAHDGVS